MVNLERDAKPPRRRTSVGQYHQKGNQFPRVAILGKQISVLPGPVLTVVAAQSAAPATCRNMSTAARDTAARDIAARDTANRDTAA